MPPIPSWYQGHAAIRALLTHAVFAGAPGGWQWRVTPTRANGQPALAIYRRPAGDHAAPFTAFTLQVLVLDPATGQVAALVNFLNPALLRCFGLPTALPPG